VTSAPRPATFPIDADGRLLVGVVDLETTGLDIDLDRILQVAVVTVAVPLPRDPQNHPDDPREAAVIVDRWSSLIRLRWPLQRVGATEIHGLRRRDLFGAPPMKSVLNEVIERLSPTIPLAHNARFDGGFLQAAATQLNLDLRIDQILCSLQMSRALDPQRQHSHRLYDLCQRFGVSLDRPHDALNDAEATAEVLPHLVAALQISQPEQLSQFSHHLNSPHTRR
jgi:DNA polymerase-3 subunit epsilon